MATSSLYVPEANAVNEDNEILEMIRTAGMGNIVTHSSSGFASSMTPFLADTGLRKLRGHLARANPHATELMAICKQQDSVDTILLFSPTNAYVSPTWYSSKGNVLPTWNYELVQVHGRVRVRDDQDILGLVLWTTISRR